MQTPCSAQPLSIKLLDIQILGFRYYLRSSTSSFGWIYNIMVREETSGCRLSWCAVLKLSSGDNWLGVGVSLLFVLYVRVKHPNHTLQIPKVCHFQSVTRKIIQNISSTSTFSLILYVNIHRSVLRQYEQFRYFHTFPLNSKLIRSVSKHIGRLSREEAIVNLALDYASVCWKLISFCSHVW